MSDQITVLGFWQTLAPSIIVGAVAIVGHLFGFLASKRKSSSESERERFTIRREKLESLTTKLINVNSRVMNTINYDTSRLFDLQEVKEVRDDLRSMELEAILYFPLIEQVSEYIGSALTVLVQKENLVRKEESINKDEDEELRFQMLSQDSDAYQEANQKFREKYWGLVEELRSLGQEVIR